MRYRSLLLLVMMLAPGVDAQPGPWSGSAGDRAAFALWERQFRLQVLRDLQSHEAVTSADQDAVRYVRRLGERLVKAAPQWFKYPCRFILFDSDAGVDVPWFGQFKQTSLVQALPGGLVLVPSSLFDNAASEAEFAAAVARGVAHVELDHYRRTGMRQSWVLIPPVDPRNHPRDYGRMPIFTRLYEMEADIAAVGILAGVGFDVEGVVRLVENPSTSFDTSERRLGVVRRAISELPARRYTAESSPEFKGLKERLVRKLTL